jgi:hypothetical protein
MGSLHSLAPRGTSGLEGRINKTKLLSPTLSSSFVGREEKTASISDGDLLNSTALVLRGE